MFTFRSPCTSIKLIMEPGWRSVGLGGVFCALPAITPPCMGSSPKRRSCAANRSTEAEEKPPKRNGSKRLEREGPEVPSGPGRGTRPGVATSLAITRARSGDPPAVFTIWKLSLGDKRAVEAGGEGNTVSISSMGVIPAMAPLERGKARETAPTSLPSTYTGLPLMPETTPVVARGPPESRRQDEIPLGGQGIL